MIRLVLAIACLALPAMAHAEPSASAKVWPGDPVREHLQSLHADWYDADRDTWRSVQVEAPATAKAAPRAAIETGMWVTAVAWCVAALLLGALAWIIWQALPRGGAQSQPERESRVATTAPDVAFAALDLTGTQDPEVALAAARAHNDWSRAVVCLYALLLADLDRAGAVRLRRGATNGRYRLDVAAWTASGEALQRATPDLLATLDDAIVAFERVYFGHLPVESAFVDALEARIRAHTAALRGEVAP